MHIRDLTVDDVVDLTNLNNANIPAVNAKTVDQMRYMLEQARWAIGAFDADDGHADDGHADDGHADDGHAARRAERLVGFLIAFQPGADYESQNFAWFSANHERFVYMDRIVVDPGQRGGGIGVKLYEALFSLIGASEPFVGIDVNLRPANDGSLRFHRRLGFETIHQQDTDGGAKTVALMVKHLS